MLVIYTGTGTDHGLNCPRCLWVVIWHVIFGNLDTSSLLYSLCWVSRDILTGEDSFASANSSPPIRISRDKQNKLFNNCNLLNSLFLVSRDILMSGDEFALTSSSPPIRISRDTQNKLSNNCYIVQLWLVQK